MGVKELSTLLWRERELLDTLAYRLEVEQLLLTNGRTRWLARASSDIEKVTEMLRATGLARTVEAEAVADEWGLPRDVTLRVLTESAPTDGPWREILEAHLAALVEATLRIRTVRDENTYLLNAATRAVQETMAAVEETVGAYDSTGSAPRETVGARMLDRNI